MSIFRHLLANTLITSVTNFTVWFAITFFVYLETRSVFATAIISGIYLVLTAFTGIWFGSLVDHHKKKTMMLFSNVVSLGFYTISFILYLSVPDDTFEDPANVTLWIFITLLMLGVIAGNIRTIAMPTLVTILIPEDRRDKANGLVGTASGISFLITSVISGLLVGAGGMLYVLILALAVLGIGLLHLWNVDIPEVGVVHLEGDAPPDRSVDIKGTLAVIRGVPGLWALIIFATINNFLGGVFMGLMDAYGLSLVSVETWGLLWGFLSSGFIVGGLLIARLGLGNNPVRSLLLINVVLWIITSLFAVQSSIVLLTIGMLLYMSLVPYIEASEQTILQKVVPYERQGRVFGFAQSVEQAASPLTAFLIGPIAQFIFIPYMTTGGGVDLIGSWFGTGDERGIALVFVLTGILGLILTLFALNSSFYRQLSETFRQTRNAPAVGD
ncbi:MAG: MFS transporter [Thermomicrobiales bacterium]